MASFEQEDANFQDEVNAVKQWWNDSRWRQTKRPFTAEQIVAKRGNLKIEYPSNVQSKKLWQIVEQNFQVRPIWLILRSMKLLISNLLIRTKLLALPMVVWNPQCSRRWQNTWTQSMFPDGRVHPRPHQPMSHPRTWLITPW
jgi:isocitrate lyase